MEQAKAPSIVQTIALGLNAIIARPWALLAALVLDVYLWQGMELRPITFAHELRTIAGDVLSTDVDQTQRQGLEQAQSLIASLESTDLQMEAPFNFVPVSYTHLTLPTILLV